MPKRCSLGTGRACNPTQGRRVRAYAYRELNGLSRTATLTFSSAILVKKQRAVCLDTTLNRWHFLQLHVCPTQNQKNKKTFIWGELRGTRGAARVLPQ